MHLTKAYILSSHVLVLCTLVKSSENTSIVRIPESVYVSESVDSSSSKKSAIIIPAPSMYYDGGCILTKRYCELKNAWGCTTWAEPRWVVETGCDYNGTCSDKYGYCYNHWEYVGAWGYDDFECECHGSSVSFGEPRKNSFVDFRTKQFVFWERAVPPKYENAEFICKPGSKDYLGYHISQQDSTFDFLCENAIGIFYSNSTTETQILYIDLDDGNDEVHLGAHLLPTVFRMGNDGHKVFWGGEDNDEFHFNTVCNGTLVGEIHGGNGTNVILVDEKCYVGKQINVVLVKEHQGQLIIGNNVIFAFTRIHKLILANLTISLEMNSTGNWNLTSVNHNKQVVSIEVDQKFYFKKSGCSTEDKYLKNRMLCMFLGLPKLVWIILTSIIVSMVLLLCFIAAWKTYQKKSKTTEIMYAKMGK